MLSEEERSGSDEATQPRIVVGVDGSPTSLSALEWAAREACLRSAILEVVHTTFLRQDAMQLDAVPGAERRESAILDEAVAMAAALAPGLVVVARVVDPPAANALVNVSKDGDLLVVRYTRYRALQGVFAPLGSVSQDSARHAQCPLVIIRPRTVHEPLLTDAERRSVSGRRP